MSILQFTISKKVLQCVKKRQEVEQYRERSKHGEKKVHCIWGHITCGFSSLCRKRVLCLHFFIQKFRRFTQPFCSVWEIAWVWIVSPVFSFFLLSSFFPPLPPADLSDLLSTSILPWHMCFIEAHQLLVWSCKSKDLFSTKTPFVV